MSTTLSRWPLFGKILRSTKQDHQGPKNQLVILHLDCAGVYVEEVINPT